MQSFSAFQNLKLSVKFMLAVLLLFAGLVFLGYSYYQTLSLERLAQLRTEKMQAFSDQIDSITSNVLQGELSEKEFFLTKDLENLNVFNQRMNELDTTINSLDGYLISDKDRKMIEVFHSIVDEYQDHFYEAVDTSIELGLTSEDGVQSDFISQLLTLEVLVENSTVTTLTERVDALTANAYRALERDNLLATQSELMAELASLSRAVSTTPIGDQVLRREILADISRMEEQLSRLTDVRQRLTEQTQMMAQTIAKIEPQIVSLGALVEDYRAADAVTRNENAKDMNSLFFLSIVLMLIALGIALWILQSGVINPLSSMQQTIERIRDGDNYARTGFRHEDEVGQLSTLLDSLLDEKEKSLREKEQENARLNTSVISLIQNVFMLSEKDLTVRVPVSEDITGAVADSINQLAGSMNEVLHDVTRFAEHVNNASQQVKQQSGTVITYAEREQDEIHQTLKGLESVVRAMQLISKLAHLSSKASQRAMNTSENAMQSVSQTVTSINKIHQTIHNAEKRIKRLGERSQEIGGIINLINSISERTHVLSLNASMHAASAGEAGRGLMVVVDEVQRLAESSREATAEIESLISNIQTETADTIAVMNDVITDVVEGTRLAEEAGARMEETRATTSTLVESVVRISQSAVKQAKLAEQLQVRAARINDSTAATNDEMIRQAELSSELVASAESLQSSVSVFKLASSPAA
ncbi:methyl-accepting chemotaxis protein [Neptunomonas phycophila]|uniref:methyl-accepting chemotaxis protein n=1 Tax=Neptunomonas phycophila TaxID=1572645 RepID=UPI000948E62F|nr:methyl-accepting chemotaxis protein [Neptunomonas phycophila]MBT3145071.1 HAMP domain-containing protein [Neptunomonas phycophila]MDO6784973.1 methyl-accepting chemotaxis protein [Neptunomonas phycophila]